MSKSEMRVTHKRVEKKSAYYLNVFRQGGQRRLGEIYDDFFPRIEKFIIYNHGSSQEAMDIFQDALMVIYRKASDPEFDLESAFYTYLYAISRNLWRNVLKKKKRTRVITEDESVLTDEQMIESDIHEKGRYALYQEKFRMLSDDCQRLLTLFFEGKRMHDIAELFETTDGYIRKKKFKCKEKLVSLIQTDPMFKELSAT